MIYLCNAFSVNMLPWLWVAEGRTVRIERVSARETGEILRNEHWTSAFGHKRSAWHLSRYLKIDIPVARTSFKLEPEDVLLVAGIESRVKWERRDRGCPEWKFYRITVMEEKTP
jgi:hypothetical protein